MTNEDLIAKLVQLLGWTEAEASRALDAMIAVMKTELEENNPVIIDDFGKFFTHKQSEYILIDRETKERYLMPPAVEVVFESLVEKNEEALTFNLFFTPEDSLNDSVNSSFSYFEPALLNEGVQIPGIPEVVAGEVDEVGQIGDVEQAGQPEQSEQIEVTGEVEELEQAAQIQAAQIEEIEKTAEVKQAEQGEEIPETKGLAQVETIPQATHSPQIRQAGKAKPNRHKRTKRKKTTALWIPIMGGVAIALAALFFFRGLQPGESEIIAGYLPGTEAEKVIIPPSDTFLHASPGTNAVYGASRTEEAKNNLPQREAEKIRLGEGKTLRLLALELFGNREFWVYIYLENKKQIINPNRVPAGTELIIPDTSTYGIDAGDPRSVSKAKEEGERALGNL